MAAPRANYDSTEEYHTRTKKSSDALLARLIEYHDYNMQAPKLTKAQIIEIMVADDEQVEKLEVCVLPIEHPILTLNAIKRVVCRHFGLSHLDLCSPRRDQKVYFPRMVVAYLAREFVSCSYPQLGRALGQRDHSTIHNSLTRLELMLSKGHPISHDISYLREILSA